MAQSWAQRFAVVRYIIRLSLIEGERQVRGCMPPWGGGPPSEADLVIAGGAATEVWVALGFLPGTERGGLGRGDGSSCALREWVSMRRIGLNTHLVVVYIYRVLLRGWGGACVGWGAAFDAVSAPG